MVGHYFKLKQGLLGNPTVYLRAKLKKTQLENGVCACAFSGVQYVYEAISIVVQNLKEKGWSHLTLVAKAENPFAHGYKSEFNVCQEFDLIGLHIINLRLMDVKARED